MTERAKKLFGGIYFAVKAFLVAAAVFLAFQLLCGLLLDGNESEGEEFLGHWYCGTFFVEMNSSHITSEYDAFVDKTKAVSVAASGVSMALALAGAASVVLVLRGAARGALYTKKAAARMYTASALCLSSTVVMELAKAFVLHEQRGCKDIFATASYHFRPHYVFALPLIMLIAGMVIGAYESGNTPKMRRLFNVGGRVLFGAALVYAAWRVCLHGEGFVRLSQNKSVAIPFYYQYMDLPSEAAASHEKYKELIILRFVKELPVIIAVTLSLLLFSRLLRAYSRGEMKSRRNSRYIYISALSLAAASIIFNALGLVEVDMFRNGFSGVYSGATYTLALRGECEPMLYALCIFVLGAIANARDESADYLPS